MFFNVRSVLSQCNTLLRLLYSVYDMAIPIKCFVSHRPPSREGGSVGRAKKKKMNTRRVLSASEGRAAKYESWVSGPFVRNQMV